MDIEFLHELRLAECQLVWEKYLKHLPRSAHILEIGGGTGMQAKFFADMGLNITSIDVADSNYRDQQVFPVQTYDGRNLPFADQTFDLVFSSNVLEHVSDLSHMHVEIIRVLRNNGQCVHVLPSGSWRWWSICTGMVDTLGTCISQSLRSLLKPVALLRIQKRSGLRFIEIFKRHGERGSGIGELYLFSRWWWIKHFSNHGFRIVDRSTTEIFYTGYSITGRKWSITSRKKIAKWLGASCNVYVMESDS